MMELDLAITGRRSIRRYTDRAVSDEALRSIIEAGMWAPSACNLQQWKFIIINDVEIFEKLYQMGTASFVRQTKQAILVLYNNQTDNVEYSDYVQSACAAIENMLLKAYSLNVGTCWVNNLPNKRKLCKLFSIPSGYEPIALVTLGYYEQKVNERPRKYDVDTAIAYNSFTFQEIEVKPWWKVYCKRIARKIYKVMPCKTFLLRFVGKLEKKFDN